MSTIESLHENKEQKANFAHWLFVDLNSYFASVEQQLDPALRNRPVGVIPVMAETTSCIAASYEAKRFGVKTGTRVFEARRLCPGICFIEAKHQMYVEYHHRIVEAVESCLPVTHVMSIDEMACRLTGSHSELPRAMELAMLVKQRIREVGSELGSSVGLGPNRYLSKVASDMQKPDGLTVIQLQDLPHKMFGLKTRDFPGIGQNMEVRLQKYGIYSVEQLYHADLRKMRTIWGGIVGERFYHQIRGVDLETSHEKNKSIGHSHVLSPRLRSTEGAYAVAQKLLHKAAFRLRKINYWARGFSVSVRCSDQTKWRQDLRIHECQDTITLNEILQKAWNEDLKVLSQKSPIKVSVTLFDLIADGDRNASFFEDKKRIELSRAMDGLNNKYHKNLVYLAGAEDAKSAAPTRIAFSSIPDFDLE